MINDVFTDCVDLCTFICECRNRNGFVFMGEVYEDVFEWCVWYRLYKVEAWASEGTKEWGLPMIRWCNSGVTGY